MLIETIVRNELILKKTQAVFFYSRKYLLQQKYWARIKKYRIYLIIVKIPDGNPSNTHINVP